MEEDLNLNKSADLFPEESLKELVEAGVFYGRKKSKVNPKMKTYVLMNRGGIEIINLYKTLESMEKAIAFVREKMKGGGFPLVVATQPAAHQLIDMAKESGFPYVAKRWLGGTLTNFRIITQRINYFKKLKADMAAGVFEKYTKKERVKIESEIERMTDFFGGLETLNRLPDFVIAVDSNLHSTAVREAKRMKIPTVVFANIDSNPDELDYLVPGNNKSRKSIGWFLGEIKKAIEEGKKAFEMTPKMEVSGEKAAVISKEIGL
ncbi:MAG: 30S ribosomal protein S2 [Candidatus Paceibacterota bacterium]|jgi:small subunit ribosomal protein S2